jgi:DNA-directed RNA polymerase specialized sigma24 family protein
VTGQGAYSEFDEAVFALLDAVESRGEFGEAELRVVTLGLGRFLGAAYGSLDRDERADVLDESLVRFITAAKAGGVDRAQSPAAYLTRTAAHVAIDALRRRRHNDPTDNATEWGEEDASLGAVVERLAGRDQVVRLMKLAIKRGEDDLVRLMRAFLDIAESGVTPTLRQLGERLGSSHTEVRRQLDRLAEMEEGT